MQLRFQRRQIYDAFISININPDNKYINSKIKMKNKEPPSPNKLFISIFNKEN